MTGTNELIINRDEVKRLLEIALNEDVFKRSLGRRPTKIASWNIEEHTGNMVIVFEQIEKEGLTSHALDNKSDTHT